MSDPRAQAYLESLEPGATWPEKHPINGKPLISLSVRGGERTRERVTRLCPTPPDLDAWYDDDDGPRQLSTDERVQATKAYESNLANWKRTRGVYYVKGPTNPTVCTFATEDGATMIGMWHANEWIWQQVRTPQAKIAWIVPRT